jgi:hypothetical protein
VFHALWACPAAEDVWGASKNIFQKCSSFGLGFMQVPESILQKSGTKEFDFFVCLARKIWFQRNKVVHGGVFTHLNQLVEDMKLSWKDYIQLHRIGIPTSSTILTKTEMKWTLPPVEWCKVNWDVAFQHDVG